MKQSISCFGEKLKMLRKQQGLTLQQLASQLGLSAHGYLSELENGKKIPTVAFTLKVAKLFNVTTDELLKDEIKLSEGKCL